MARALQYEFAVMKRCALIVDDEAVMGRMLVDGLQEFGWGASAATGVANALELFGSGHYTVVVSDLVMHDGDGFELLVRIHSGSTLVPVILMSPFGRPETSRQVREAGAFAYLPKPFELAKLVELLDRAANAGRSPG